MSNTAAEVINSDCFIVTGSNTTENHPIIALQMKAAVRKHGAKMIVIDPRRIELCDFAELWLPLKPGTNVPVFGAMAHVIVTRAGQPEFIAERTEGLRGIRPLAGEIHPRICRERSPAWTAEPDRPGGAHVRHGRARRHLLGHGHLAALARHRQRPGPDPPGFADRAHRARGHRAQPAARPEQRAGRLRYAARCPSTIPGYMEVDDEANARKWERPGTSSRAG
jgi:anaerobic selenocysteine-containing dehydrogenase